MAKGRIDSIIVKEKIEAELQYLSSNLDELSAKIKTFPPIKARTEGASGLQDLVKAQAQYAEGIKAVEQLVRGRFASEAKLVTLQTDYARETAKTRVEISKTTAELKAQAKVDLAGTNTLEKVRALRAKIRLEVDKTNLNDSERIKVLNDRINKLTEVEKKFSDGQRQQSLNVGNYQGSAKIIVDALERVRIKSEQVTKQFGPLSPEAAAARREFEALDRITSKPQFLNIASKVGDTNKELRFFVQRLNELEDAGLKNSSVYKDVQTRLAGLQDQLGDTRQEIKALSSDSRGFDLFAGSVKFAADTFQTAAGAVVLFGGSEEDAAQATATLTAVMSISNGVKGIATELTTKGTAANVAFAFVQGLVATALDKTATSAVRARAALGLLGIAATVIGVIAIAYAALSKTTSDAAIKQENLNDALKQAGSEYGRAVEQINSLRNNVELAKAGFISKTEVVKQYNESMGKVTGQAKNLNEVEQQLNKNAQAYIDFTFAKATATAALAKASQLAVDQQLELLNTTTSDGDAARLYQNLTGLTDDQIKQGEAGQKKKIQQSLQKQIDDLLAFAKLKQQEAAQKAKDNKFDFFGGAGDKGNTDKSADAIAERRRQAIFAARQLELDTAAELEKRIIEIETFSFEERAKAYRNYLELKKTMINEEASFEKEKKGLTVEEINLIEQNRIADLGKLNREASNLFTVVAREAVQATVEELSELPPEAQAIFDKINKSLENSIKLTLGILTDAQIEAIDKIGKAFDKLKEQQDIKDAYTDTFQTIADLEGSILSGIFDRQKNRIQEQIDDIDRLKAAEIDRVNASGDNEEKKAARIKIIEAKAQADKEALARKQRAVERQQAIAAKALNVFQMTIDGLQAIAKQKLIVAEIKAKLLAAGPAGPVLFGPALALATANLFGTIISSGASVAAALATPIPKFFKGKTKGDSYQGPGIVGDQGRELGISKDGTVSLYDRPTLTHLMKGDVILPNQVTEDVLATISMTKLAGLNGVKANADNTALLDMTGKVVGQLKELNNKSRIIINNEKDITTTAWYDYHFKH